jgi:hypothetical protein
MEDFLLKRTGDGREGVIRVRTDQSDSANYEYKDYGKHHGIFRNILTLLVEEDVGGSSARELLSSQIRFGWVTLRRRGRQSVMRAATCQHANTDWATLAYIGACHLLSISHYSHATLRPRSNRRLRGAGIVARH